MHGEVAVVVWFGLAILVVGLLLLSWQFSKEARIKRAIRRLRHTPIDQIRAPGLFKVQGVVRHLDTLTAPLSGRPCAYFEVIVEERVSSGKSSHWRTVIHEIDERDFLLEDDTGRARIEMVAVKAAVTKDAHWSSGTFNDATPELETFLARHGQQSQGWLFNRTLRYREGVIEAGEIVAAVGRADFEMDPEPTTSGSGYREAPKRVVLRAAHEEELLVSDDPTTLG